MDTTFILLVEDNPDDAALTLRVLRQSHIAHEVVVTRDGTELLDFLFGTGAFAGRDTSKLPQMVLLDLNLPKMDGFKVLSRLRGDARTRVLPVVVLTASREERDVAQSYEAGANSYVCKPVDFDEFAEVVRSLGVYWLYLNEAPLKEQR